MADTILHKQLPFASVFKDSGFFLHHCFLRFHLLTLVDADVSSKSMLMIK
jgi:hypothetical protein